MKTIIEMAREANVYCTTRQPTLDAMLERFAALVRADEKERIIKVIESMGTWAHINEVIDEVRKNT